MHMVTFRYICHDAVHPKNAYGFLFHMKKNKKWEGKYQPLRCTLSRVLMKCARGCTSIWWMCNCSFFSETTDGFDLKRIVEQTSVTFKSCCCCVHGCCCCSFIRSFRCACNVIWNVWKHWSGTLLVAPDTQIELQVIPKYSSTSRESVCVCCSATNSTLSQVIGKSYVKMTRNEEQ